MNKPNYREYQWVNALVYSNTWIAFAAGLLTAASQVLLYQPVDILGVFVFFATLFVYNVQRLLRLNREILPNPTPWSEWLAGNFILLLVISIVSAIVTVGFLVQMNAASIGVLAPFGIISFLYAGNFLRIKSLKVGLREVPFLKLFWISITWVGVTVLLPAAAATHAVNVLDLLYLTVGRFLLVAALAIAFDVRDLPYDMPFQRTIPQILGIDGARGSSIALVLLFMVLAAIPLWWQGTSVLVVTAQWIAGVLTIQLLRKMTPERNEYFFSGWLDGTLVLQGTLILLAARLHE